MTHKFIALRRTPPPQGKPAGAPLNEIRAARMEVVHDTYVQIELEQAGLRPHNPYAEDPDGPSRYAPLPYLDAILVGTPDPKLAQRARGLLEPEYLIMPNLELALPVAERGRMYQRLPPEAAHLAERKRRRDCSQLGHHGQGCRGLRVGQRGGCRPC